MANNYNIQVGVSPRHVRIDGNINFNVDQNIDLLHANAKEGSSFIITIGANFTLNGFNLRIRDNATTVLKTFTVYEEQLFNTIDKVMIYCVFNGSIWEITELYQTEETALELANQSNIVANANGIAQNTIDIQENFDYLMALREGGDFSQF